MALTSDQEEALALASFEVLAKGSTGRLELLKHMAAVVIHRPSGWNPDDVRQQFLGLTLYTHASECFGCKNRDRRKAWHHVIQIQHGGSNCRGNLVSICEVCHGRIHPWLPVSLAHAGGWSQAGER